MKLVNKKIAVLLTCYNRKNKTLQCLASFFASKFPEEYYFDFFLVDDGSTDGTSEIIKERYPNINIIKGNGNLFWAGGMRYAFDKAQKNNDYDAYLLLNDDVVLLPDFFNNILETQKYCLEKHEVGGLYSGSTIDKDSNKTTYGGNLLKDGIDNPYYKILIPTNKPQECHLANANILYVEKVVVDTIGFLDRKFIHGIADYDFSLRAFKAGFPVYITPNHCGYCKDDHGGNLSNAKTLKERIKYLKSPLGNGYEEYLFYAKRHFPKHFSLIWIKLWFRTLFPSFFTFIKK